ncbi:MAG: hypothetical protein LBP94_04075 [Zoogloeaceae bacterium]|jgi:hypothetical protein|nr:hypothetical protein [Zoogloeaceae bacterium]
MPRRKPAALPSHHLRLSIASAAARLMAEDGIGDYGLAKRKAAKMLGAGESETLPSNEEVAAELRAYQALFQEEEQAERLRELRKAALSAMEFLADFRPCLTGAVLDGTAGRYAEPEIALFVDSAKDVEIFLLSHNISYEIAANRQQGPNSPETRLRLDWDDTGILLSIYPLQAERWQKTGSPSGRARTEAVAALLVD